MDVRASKKNMEDMLRYSNGHRKVPVIVDGESVLVGFGGGA